jgi:hypothetical protein
MIWVRSKIRSCARLALFALAVQMAVSFGHIHRDDLGLPALAAADHAILTSDRTHPPAGPSDEDQLPGSDGYCPICASIALVSSGIPSLPPQLIVPPATRPVWRLETRARVAAPKAALPFQARAPPIV